MEFPPSECSPTPRNPTLALRSSRFFSLAPRPNGDHSLRCTRVMMAPFFLAPERERRPARSAALLFPPQNSRPIPSSLPAAEVGVTGPGEGRRITLAHSYRPLERDG